MTHKKSLLVLSLLKDGDKYGYEMAAALAMRSDDSFQLKEGTLYSLLHAMEKEKWVKSYIKEASGGRARKYYHLTNLGWKKLSHEETEWKPFPESVNSVLCFRSPLGSTMYKMKFDRWCQAATAQIRFVPDRMPVMGELQAHMEDHYADLLARGVEPQEAVRQTLEAMGDPRAIAPQLAAIHRPFWGRAEQVTRWAVTVMAFVTVLAFGFYILLTCFVSPAVYESDPYDRYTEENTQLLYLEPGDTVYSDGYALTLSKVVWENEDTFRFQISAFTLLPWAEHTDIGRWFEAEDSLGNDYFSVYESGLPEEPSVMGNPRQVSRFTCVHNMWLDNFCSQDAQWIELRYDRGGREISFRIDLTGGSGA